MAVSTYKTFLMYKESAAEDYTKLVDITSVPDLGGTPNMLETTTLSDDTQTFIPGIKQIGDGFEFTANYNLKDYQNLKQLEEQEKEYAVWKGGTGSGSSVTPTGDDGKWEFSGQLTVYPTGGGVDEVFGLTINIAPSTPITPIFSTGTTITTT